MPTEDFDIHITPETVKAWEEGAAVLEKEIADKQAALVEVRQKISAVPLFLKTQNGHRASLRVALMAVRAEMQASTPLTDMRPPTAVLSVLREIGGGPIAVGRLREEMQKRGYPMERFGKGNAYFYQIVGRLHDGEKIEKNGDEVTLRQ